MEILKPLAKMLGTALTHAVPSFLVDKNGRPMGDASYPMNVVATENENVETSKTAVTTWYVVPTNAKGVHIQVNSLGEGVKANVEFSYDRAGVVAGTTTTVEEWSLGELTNKVGSASFGPIAGIRMKSVTTNAIAEVKSSYTTALAGDNNDIVYTSKLTGTAGDAITIAYVDPSDVDQTLSVDVTGTDIVVNLATDAGGIITSTADDIKTAIAAKAEANALVGTADAALNDGSGVVTALAETNLANGVNAVAATLPKMFITVV